MQPIVDETDFERIKNGLGPVRLPIAGSVCSHRGKIDGISVLLSLESMQTTRIVKVS